MHQNEFNSLRVGDLLRYNSQSLWQNTHLIVTQVHKIAREVSWVVSQEGTLELRWISSDTPMLTVIKPKSIDDSSWDAVSQQTFEEAWKKRKYTSLVSSLLSDINNHNDYLLPCHTITVKWRTFWFPAQVEYGTLWKLRIPMWTYNPDWLIDIRYVYFSDSDGRLHVAPWIEGSWRLIKADSISSWMSYINWNRLDPELEYKIFHLYFSDSPVARHKLPQLKWFTVGIWVDFRKDIHPDHQIHDFQRETKPWYWSHVFWILWLIASVAQPSHWSEVKGITVERVLQTLNATKDTLRRLIDFSNVKSTYQHLSWRQGYYSVDVIESYLAWRMIEWHIANNDGVNYWLDNIFVRTPYPLNSFGVHSLSVNAWWLIAKPWEYESQVWAEIMKDPRTSELIGEREGYYVNTQKFAYANPVAQLYKEYKSSRR